MFIRQADLLEGRSANVKHFIEAQGIERNYKAGEIVFKEGDEGGYFYMLESGKVDLSVGKQEEMRFLVHYPGEIFGLSALVKPYPYLASARCTTDSTTTKVPKSVIDIISKDYPSDGRLINEYLAGILAEGLIEAYRENLPSRLDRYHRTDSIHRSCMAERDAKPSHPSQIFKAPPHPSSPRPFSWSSASETCGPSRR